MDFKMIVDDKPVHGDVNELFCYVATENGKAGICAAWTALGVSPMVGMTLADMDKWQPAVTKLREETDKDIKLVRYIQAEVINE